MSYQNLSNKYNLHRVSNNYLCCHWCATVFGHGKAQVDLPHDLPMASVAFTVRFETTVWSPSWKQLPLHQSHQSPTLTLAAQVGTIDIVAAWCKPCRSMFIDQSDNVSWCQLLMILSKESYGIILPNTLGFTWVYHNPLCYHYANPHLLTITTGFFR